MTVDPIVLVTIACMAIMTYATRLSGYLVMARFGMTKRLATWLRYVPGAVLISLVAPSILPASSIGLGIGASGALTGGTAELLAAAAAIVVAAKTKNLLLTIAAGVITVWILRRLFGG